MADLYEHQRQAVEKLRSGSVLKGGVGSGKSRTALAYFYRKVCEGDYARNGKRPKEMLHPRPLYIITTAKKRDDGDWRHECVHFGLSTDAGVGPVDVYVDSWQNIKKYQDVTGAFFIFDEQRLVGTGAWVKAFLKISKANEWILLTATPGDSWIDYAPVFIANGFYKNITDFRTKHVLYHRFAKYPKIVGYIGEERLEKCRKRIVVDMPYEKKAIRHQEYVKVGYSEDLYKFVYDNRWDAYRNEPIQNASALCYILRKVVNYDSRRFNAIVNLHKNHPKMIIFYNFDYELERLRWFSEQTGIPYSEWNGHKHEPILTGDSWLYLVQYTAGAEGWNCVETDTIVFYSQNYSYKTVEQACGRIDRLNTPFTDLYYYHIFSDAPIDKAIRKCLAKKKDFNERVYLESLSFA